MNLRQFAGKLLRSIPFLIVQGSRLMARTPPAASPPSPDSLREVRKILVVRLDAIGDFLMTTPALRSLQKRFPSARMDILVQPGVAAVAKTFPGIHDLHTLRCQFLIPGGRRLPGILEWIAKLIELRRRRYDLVVDFSGLFHSAAASWATGARIRIGFRHPIPTGFFTLNGFGGWHSHVVEANESIHIADQMLLLPLALGGAPDSGGWEPSHESDSAAETVLKLSGITPDDGPLVFLHPGGKWPPKRWSAKNFAAVIDILQEKNIRVAVIGGPGDDSLVDEIRTNCRTAPIFLWPPEPLETIRGVLKRSDVFLGNDSGPMHMAAAAGTPVVALFGPTDPKRSAPRGSEFIPFYAALDCSPCPLYFSKNLCHRGHNYCMDNFDPAEVAAAVANLTRESGHPRRTPSSSRPQS